ERLRQEGLIHHGIELRFEGRPYRIDLTELTGGRSITVYGQQEVVKDLIRARLDAGGQIRFEAEALGFAELDADRPRVRYLQAGHEQERTGDWVAGCAAIWVGSRQESADGRTR